MSDPDGPSRPGEGVPIGRLRLMQITRRHLESVCVDKSADLTENLAPPGAPNTPVDPPIHGETDSSHPHRSS